jgi:hypothetical protein
MATSNNTVWQQTGNKIISAALRKIGVVGEGESASTIQLSDALPMLNGLISEFQAHGMFLWKRNELEIPFVAGQDQYVLGEGQVIDTPYPLKVSQAIVSYSGGAQVDMEIIPHFNFNLLTKNTSGIPIKGSYQPKNDVGIFYVWPIPDTSAASNNTLLLTYQEPFDVFVTGLEDIDFPREWVNPLVYGVASMLADDYMLPLEDRRWIERQADKRLAIVLSAAQEETGTFFYPDRRE